MTTTKTYKSRSCIAINIIMGNKANRHISFEPMTDGSSTFTTSSPEIQEAIEKHYNYGKLFRLEGQTSVSSESKTCVESAANEVHEETSACCELTKVEISDIEAAKDYLADTFGISRTSLRSKTSIMEKAQAHNIEFVGL